MPLTFDLKTVGKQLADSTIGLAGRETAIGDALGLAVKRLRDRPQDQRVLVLLTDGVNTAGELDPRKAIDLAAANNVRVYTIGVGAEALRVNSLFGSRVVNPSADLDEAMLKRMAEATGGRYFRARNSDELADIYRTIDQLEPVADTKQSLRPVDELYWMPLAAALGASALAFLRAGLAHARADGGRAGEGARMSRAFADFHFLRPLWLLLLLAVPLFWLLRHRGRADAGAWRNAIDRASACRT